MEIMFVFYGIAILFGIIILKGIVIVPQADLYVIERLGKFKVVLTGGFNIIIPGLDKIVNKITTKEQIINIPKQAVITKDNVSIDVDGIVFMVLQDAYKSTYNVINFRNAVGNLAITTLRSEIGSISLDEVLGSREKINSKILTVLDEASNNWGIKVTRIEISDISVPKEIKDAMSMQMKAEREKRAIELKALADKEAVIRDAEAHKQKVFLEAEAQERQADAEAYQQEKIAKAQQNSMNMINEAMSKNKLSSEFLLAKDRIQAFNELAKNPSKDKIVVPYESTELVGALSVLKDILKDKK